MQRCGTQVSRYTCDKQTNKQTNRPTDYYTRGRRAPRVISFMSIARLQLFMTFERHLLKLQYLRSVPSNISPELGGRSWSDSTIKTDSKMPALRSVFIGPVTSNNTFNNFS